MINITINGNSVQLKNGSTVNDLLSSKILRLEKYDVRVLLNKVNLSTEHFYKEIPNSSVIDIKIGPKTGLNLGPFKSYVYNVLFLFKRLKKILDFSLTKVYFYTLLTPFYIHKNPSIKFYTPNAIVLSRSRAMLSSEVDTIKWIDSFDKDAVFVDIGANIGTYSLYAGSCVNKVISIEPLWSNYSVLCDNILLNDLADKIIPLNIALSDTIKIESLQCSSVKAGASHNSIDSASFQSEMIKVKSKVNVMCDTLDNVWETFNLPIPSHVKIDVDGIEERVIYGGEWLLKKHNVQSILVECSILESNSIDNIINFLSSLNFKLDAVSGVSMNTINFSKLTSSRGACGTINLIFVRS